jgi:serine/threonine protein kinase
MGTPRYMSPEQVAGEPVDVRSDLFAAGTILFEMLAGRPAFAGTSIVEVLHATRYEQPPALTGSPAVAAVDRVIRRRHGEASGRSAGVGRRHGRRAARHPRHRERIVAGDGPGADPARGAAVPRPASRRRNRLSSPSACPTRSPRRCPPTPG